MVALSLLVAATANAAPPAFVLPVADATSQAGQPPSLWYVQVVPGTAPESTGLRVFADMRAFGGPLRARFADGFAECQDDTTDLAFVACDGPPVNATPGTYTVAVTVEDAQGRSTTVAARYTVVPPADADADGLPDIWESRFGLDPASAVDASADPDADGSTNLYEFAAGTHPRGTTVRYLAEGATSPFFETELSLYNPHAGAATVLVRMQASDGATTVTSRPVASRGVLTLSLAAHSPGNDFSIVVESDLDVVVERTMRWGHWQLPADTGAYGSHSESARPAPERTWYLAEGATHGGFDLFYLLQNPGTSAATVTVRYLRPAPLAPLTKTYTVGPHTRRTLWIDAEDPGLSQTDVSAVLDADVPIVVEQAMYLSTSAQPFAAGHVGAGAVATSTTWYFAEGATGFFDAYLLLANPGTSDSNVTLSFFVEGLPQPLVRTISVSAGARRTIDLNGEPELLGRSFATTATASVPILAERSMWWPSGNWQEGHLVTGARAPAARWATAGGRLRVSRFLDPRVSDIDTFILVANPSDLSATVTVTFDRSGPALTVTRIVPAHGRITVSARDVWNALAGSARFGWDETFGVTVASAGPAIVVERATYEDDRGTVWAAGAALLATPIP